MSLGGGTLSSETINHVNPITSPSYTNHSFQVDSYSWRGRQVLRHPGGQDSADSLEVKRGIKSHGGS